jgi:hypothetical protein
MITNDDIQLVLAYFNLSARRDYCPHEIVYRPTIRARFTALARRMLGDVSDKEIVLRLASLKKTSACE